MLRTYAFPLALGSLLALAGVLTVLALRPAPAPGRAEIARQIAAELRCPDCQGLSVADSNSVSAVEIRRQIDEQLTAGRTPDEVRQSFVDRYGDWILLSPTGLVAWLLPALVLLVAVSALAVWIWRGRERSTAGGLDAGGGQNATAQPSVTEQDRARVREEAEALD